MRGDLPKREPELLARWRADGAVAAAARGVARAGRNSSCMTARPTPTATCISARAEQDPQGRGQPRPPDGRLRRRLRPRLGLPRPADRVEDRGGVPQAGRDKDAVPVLQFRAECRAYAQHWMGVQAQEFQRLGVLGDWEQRYATMDFAVRGGDRRRDRQVPAERRAVSRAAAGDVVAGGKDRAGRGRDRVPRPHQHRPIFVRFPVVQRAGRRSGRRLVVIWTTTPWTMPGNRAIACGAGHRLRAWCASTASAGRRAARPGEMLLVALALLPQVCAAAGIATHHVLRIDEGRRSRRHRSAPIRCAAAATTSTCRCCRAITSPPRPAPASSTSPPATARRISSLGQAHGLEVPDTVGEDGTFNAWVPLFAGAARLQGGRAGLRRARRGRRLLARGQTHALLSAFLALARRR